MGRMTDWDIWDFMHGFDEKSLAIYVMTVNGLSCKIGYATNLGNRCSNLQVGSIDDICIFWAARLVKAQAIKLEKMCHDELKIHGRHLRGEWFRIQPPVAVEVIKRLARAAKFEMVQDLAFGFGRE